MALGQWNPLSSNICLMTRMLIAVIADTGLCMGSGRIEKHHDFIGERRQGKSLNTWFHDLTPLLNQDKSWDREVPGELIPGRCQAMLDLLMTLFAVGSRSSLEQMVGMLCTTCPWDSAECLWVNLQVSSPWLSRTLKITKIQKYERQKEDLENAGRPWWDRALRHWVASPPRSLVTILAFRNARPQRLGENREQLNLCGRGSENI